LHLTLRSG